MKKVLILFGSNSYEHEISCKSVNFIIKNIDKNLFDYKVVGIDFDNAWYEVNYTSSIDINWKNKDTKKIDNINVYLKHFDIVFPIIHGNTFEDGKLQSLFELNNIKYVGCDQRSSLISYDKLLTKLILEKYNIPQVPYTIYNKKSINNLTYPVIIKPCKCGSSIGISIANNKKELYKGIEVAKKYDKDIIIEKFIKNNIELECAVLQDKDKLIISDVGQILKEDSWYDYDSKYTYETNTIISKIDIKVKNKIKKLSKAIFEIIGCKNLSRLDYIYDLDSNILYFNEINTMPGFTNISMYPKLILNEGISYKELITILLN